MRVVQIYALLDRKLRQFGPLMLEANEQSMRRSLRAGIPGTNSMMEKYPEDFDLYEIGAFDSETGVVVQEVPALVDTLSVVLREDSGLRVQVAKEA